MLRIVNPVLHTKYLHINCMKSMFLWWTTQSCADTWNTFLQFGAWKQTQKGAIVAYDQIWKYPSFHTAYADMTYIMKHVPKQIDSSIFQYQHEPLPRPRLQSMGAAPPSVNAAFTALNGLLPKKPL